MNEKYKEMQKAGLAIRIRGLKKEYRLGQIGSTTLQREIKRWWARKRGLEDPYSKIGQPKRVIGERFMALNGIDLIVHKGETAEEGECFPTGTKISKIKVSKKFCRIIIKRHDSPKLTRTDGRLWKKK